MVTRSKSYIMGIVKDFRHAIVVAEGEEIASWCRKRGISYQEFTQFINRQDTGHPREAEYLDKMKKFINQILG